GGKEGSPCGREERPASGAAGEGHGAANGSGRSACCRSVAGQERDPAPGQGRSQGAAGLPAPIRAAGESHGAANGSGRSTPSGGPDGSGEPGGTLGAPL